MPAPDGWLHAPLPRGQLGLELETPSFYHAHLEVSPKLGARLCDVEKTIDGAADAEHRMDYSHAYCAPWASQAGVVTRVSGWVWARSGAKR